MTDLPTGDNRTPDMILDAEVLKIIEEYAELDEQSHTLNGRRAELRAKADKKMGIQSYDLQSAVHKLKKMTKAERVAHEKTVARIIRAVDGRQAEFWPDEVAAATKRAATKAEKAAKAKSAAGGETPEQQERRVAADTNPRSDPKRGGAGKKPKAPTAKATGAGSAPDATEQAEGEAVLAAGMPLSQSAQAAAIRSKSGLN